MEQPKVKVIIKRPDEEIGHVTNISASKQNIERNIGGPYMFHTLFNIDNDHIVGIMYKTDPADDDAVNMTYGIIPFRKVVKGDAIIGQVDANGNLVDLDQLTRKEWAAWLEKWGN